MTQIREVRETDQRTSITWTLDLRLRGINRLATPLLGPLLRRLGRKALDGLEHRLRSPV